MSYLRHLCLFAHSGVYHILCCVFVLFFFVLLSVSLECPFLNALLAIIYYDLLNNIIYLLLSINIILRGRDRMVVAFATT
jgi:lipopolysaccharide export LptBFGC system permease protein LptF